MQGIRKGSLAVLCAAAALSSLLLNCGGGGGGGGSSPTAPVRYVNASGWWSGPWYYEGILSLPTTLFVSQSSGSATGSVTTIIGSSKFTFQWTGTVSVENSDGSGTLEWRAIDPSGSLGGTMAVRRPSMSGNVTLATYTDGSAGGLMVLTLSSASTAGPEKPGSSDIGEFIRAIRSQSTKP